MILQICESTHWDTVDSCVLIQLLFVEFTSNIACDPMQSCSGSGSWSPGHMSVPMPPMPLAVTFLSITPALTWAHWWCAQCEQIWVLFIQFRCWVGSMPICGVGVLGGGEGCEICMAFFYGSVPQSIWLLNGWYYKPGTLSYAQAAWACSPVWWCATHSWPSNVLYTVLTTQTCCIIAWNYSRVWYITLLCATTYKNIFCI